MLAFCCHQITMENIGLFSISKKLLSIFRRHLGNIKAKFFFSDQMYQFNENSVKSKLNWMMIFIKNCSNDH